MHITLASGASHVVTIAACYSDNIPKSIFGASSVTDEDFDNGKVQPACPDWYVCVPSNVI